MKKKGVIMLKLTKSIMQKQKGVTMIEYALLLTFVLLLFLAFSGDLRTAVEGVIARVVAALGQST